MWKEVIGPNLSYCAGVYLEELRNKKIRMIVCGPRFVPRTSEECFTLSCEILLLQFPKQKIK